MFNRYSITALPSSLELKFKAKIPVLYHPNFNAAPDQSLPVILNDRMTEVTMARWGMDSQLIKTGKSNLLFYTKDINSLKSNETFLQALVKRRCLVLADGFYLWKFITKKSSVPYRVVAKTEKIFCFCGIWEEFQSNKFCFFILTRNSYKPVNELSDQMPVVLSPPDELKWLSGNLPKEKVLHEAEIEDWAFFKYYPVSPRIKDPSINSPSLIQISPSADQHGNLTLFD